MRRLLGMALLSALACGPHHASGPQGVGDLKVEGPGQALQALPHSPAVVYLRRPTHPTGKLMPPDAYLGELALLTPNGEVKGLGGEATNLTGEIAFSADASRVAFLDHFSFDTHLGDLVVATVATGESRPVASDVSYFGFRGDSTPSAAAAAPLFDPQALGYISGPRAELRVGDHLIDQDVATFEFVQGGELLVYRQRPGAGGDLRVYGRLAPGAAAAKRTLAQRVGDYQVAPKGNALAYTVINADGSSALHVTHWGKDDVRLGDEVSSFQFSPDGRNMAYVGGLDLRKLLGDLYVANLDGDQHHTPVLLGKSAGTYRFGADGRLAFIHEYYEPNRAGRLSLWDPQHGLTPIVPSARVFGFSPSGKYLGYLNRIFKPDYTEQLMLLPLGPLGAPLGESRLVGEGIYAFDFTPDERALLYKTSCTRGGEACDLMSIPTDAPPAVVSDGGQGKNPAARKLVSAIDGYDFSPDGKWLWITFKSAVGTTADLAVLPSGPEPGLPRYVDFKVEPTPRWTGDGHLAYLVNLPKRAGLYLADPNKAQPLLKH